MTSTHTCFYCSGEGTRHNGYFTYPCGHCQGTGQIPKTNLLDKNALLCKLNILKSYYEEESKKALSPELSHAKGMSDMAKQVIVLVEKDSFAFNELLQKKGFSLKG